MAVDPGGNQGVFDPGQTVLQYAQSNMDINQIAKNVGWNQQQVINYLNNNGYTVKTNYPSVGGVSVQGPYAQPSYTYTKSQGPASGTSLRQDNPAPPTPKTSGGGSGLGNVLSSALKTGINSSQAAKTKASNPDLYDPGWRQRPSSTWDANELSLFQNEMNSQSSNLGSGAYNTAAADLAEKKREFDVTTSRDIAKENAAEIDSLQKLIAGQTGPKDPYGYLFESRGLAAPQGYSPTALPFTSAQEAAWLGANPGKSRQDLINVFTGGGKPPGWVDQKGGNSLLGNIPQSLQPMTPTIAPKQASPLAAPQATPQPNVTPQQAGMPPVPGNVPNSPPTNVAPPTPGGVPSMAVGGQVPGTPGEPQLTVLHGGEQVDPNGVTPTVPPTNANVHPAIAKLLDAISELVASPDFSQFTGALQGNAPQMPGSKPTEGTSKGKPGPEITPGGVQSMAAGGMVNSTQPTGPLGGMNSGLMPPQASGQISNIGAPLPQDKPIIPMSQLDPYTKALYDRMGRLHPYSAQQEAQMGPSGVQGVQNYLGKVAGVNVDDYVDLSKRLAPQAGAPQMGDIQSEGFTTG